MKADSVIRKRIRTENTMKSQENKTRVAVAALALTTAIAVLAAAVAFPSRILADNEDVTTFTVDIAEDSATNAQNDVNPSEGNDVFSPGDTFFLAGTIYPAGTLPSGKANNNPNAPGGIGKFRARGTYTTDFPNFERAVAGAPNAAPVMAFASEIFSLPNDGTTILTDGLWPNAHFSLSRVVLGGTGGFGEVVGEAIEQNIGENATGFCNLRVTFRLRKVVAGNQH
jgi:hypothetical protein